MWDVNALPNGPRYLVRIATQDDGTPSLGGSDVTDGTCSLARPGGDTEGPTLWAGSVRVSPRPPGTGYLATFRATADDRTRGGSAVAAAGLFLQIAPPNPVDSGLGLPMGAVDGSFDGSVENMSWLRGPNVAGGKKVGWGQARGGPRELGAFFGPL